MTRFLTALQVEQMAPDRWRLLRELVYESDLLGQRRIVVPTGFVTDFDSIPRWLPLTYALLSGAARAPAVLHDLAYQIHKVGYEEISRRKADRLLWEAMGASGPGVTPLLRWKRWLIWLGVRVGGGAAWRSGPERLKILWDRRQKPRTGNLADDRAGLERRARHHLHPPEKFPPMEAP